MQVQLEVEMEQGWSDMVVRVASLAGARMRDMCAAVLSRTERCAGHTFCAACKQGVMLMWQHTAKCAGGVAVCSVCAAV